jgi:hypothetical protein
MHWYNIGHFHIGIRYVSPAQRHAVGCQAILAARHTPHLNAQERDPALWSGATRDWTLIETKTFNPERDAVVKTTASNQHIQFKAA